jgi:hypothetical protein
MALETNAGYDVTEPKRLSKEEVGRIDGEIKALE